MLPQGYGNVKEVTLNTKLIKINANKFPQRSSFDPQSFILQSEPGREHSYKGVRPNSYIYHTV